MVSVVLLQMTVREGEGTHIDGRLVEILLIGNAFLDTFHNVHVSVIVDVADFSPCLIDRL